MPRKTDDSDKQSNIRKAKDLIGLEEKHSIPYSAGQESRGTAHPIKEQSEGISDINFPGHLTPDSLQGTVGIYLKALSDLQVIIDDLKQVDHSLPYIHHMKSNAHAQKNHEEPYLDISMGSFGIEGDVDQLGTDYDAVGDLEAELSEVVRSTLLPLKVPSIPGLEIAAYSRPAGIAGGDYFDFIQFNDNNFGFAIADVSGHGVSAGMLLSSLQTALRTLIPEAISPEEVLERLNNFYIHNINFTTFVTIFLASFDPSTHVLSYVNAGHNPPVVYRSGKKEIQRLRPTAPAIGLADDFHPRKEIIVLSKGDLALLYTDGLTEGLNSRQEQFGEERVSEIILQNAHLQASDLIEVIRQSLDDFMESKVSVDDITMIALKFSE